MSSVDVCITNQKIVILALSSSRNMSSVDVCITNQTLYTVLFPIDGQCASAKAWV